MAILGSVACQTAGMPDTQPGPIEPITVDTLILDVLDKANEPLPARRIARQLDAPTRAVSQTLAMLRRRGVVFKVGNGSGCRWVGGEKMVSDTAVGFPAIIEYYRRLDPRIAVLLEHDYRQFQERVQGKHMLGEYKEAAS